MLLVFLLLQHPLISTHISPLPYIPIMPPILFPSAAPQPFHSPVPSPTHLPSHPLPQCSPLTISLSRPFPYPPSLPSSSPLQPPNHFSLPSLPLPIFPPILFPTVFSRPMHPLPIFSPVPSPTHLPHPSTLILSPPPLLPALQLASSQFDIFSPHRESHERTHHHHHRSLQH
ncbi:hypothetical protein Pcinc_018289 [Petrolisthes cinctipes]|uniref:Uncharacterized protein n=1 Tax=Petrolisthes cinctipes TaxID=88211 RepID=A0AAE1FMQ0_PETCI|nr:hypothetical protein Pcinc_018289 [Petrolisthes cinctipes]